MPQNANIADLKNLKESDAKHSFSCIAVLKGLQARAAKNGSEYLSLEFGDSSGILAAMCFEGSACFNQLRESAVGDAFELSLTADFYQGRFSPKIDGARKLDQEEIDRELPRLASVSPCNPEKMREELHQIIGCISYEPLRETVRFAISEAGEKFFTSTAAIKMHHAYVYGLLEHSLKAARMARALLPLYPFIDADLALAGCILHDIGKVEEYSQSLAPDRTRAGMLFGHVVIGYRMVRRAGLKSGLDSPTLERLEHIILSHQGEPEWGAAVRAATPEAVFVSNIDNFDAKMGSVEAALSSAQNENEFTEVPALRIKMLTSKIEHQ